MMLQQPKSMRASIGIFGRRNVGKSSLMNILSGFTMSLVSPVAGTTTDPVEKSVELPFLGPVVLVDTAGIDDEGELGTLRVQKSEERARSVSLALVVTDGVWGTYEEEVCTTIAKSKIPIIIVWNKSDIITPNEDALQKASKYSSFSVSLSAMNNKGLDALFDAMLQALPEEALLPPPLLQDLIPTGKICIFVTPIDKSAPKGRLIAPQVQALRDALDGHCISLVVQTEELHDAINALRDPPHLVVCDSQAVHECARILPESITMTTFSILMARIKGDLSLLAQGAAAISSLKEGDQVYICEACAHHAQDDDIGKVKIPQMLRNFTKIEPKIDFYTGKGFPRSIPDDALIIHCGGCMLNRPAMLARIQEAQSRGASITNYGVAISLMQGVLERSLQCFPAALALYQKALSAGK